MQRIAPPVILVSFLDIHRIQELTRIIMALSSEQKKAYKRIGHHLKPVVIVSEQGASEGVLAELDRALNDHELIKIRITVGDRDTKQALIDELCQASGAELVQVIGKMVILLRRNKKANPNLSNLARFKDF
ncbi:RNA-binding protein [Halopseudomonas bauzanensis]|uniref:RNA-binding protein n=2 Tax=Halopseudomonas bauzanensis TaxID=653930 RepID=A0A1I4MCG1_9GAMM|nr:RNA-binding protein [Halopseudomonas bauzanensis]SFM00961.1 RNA-binding protein [Halopseudomonas bauzanensis]